MSADTPDWARDAVFYQIFPDRFAASDRVAKPGALEPWDSPPTTHGFKYRLVYVVGGERVVGFDNERGKGDHCHLEGIERPYCFITLDRLIEDFIAEVEKRRTP